MAVAIRQKRTVGERVDVTADIFGDGHDHIVQKCFTGKGASEWHVVEMEHLGQRQLKASFYVTEKVPYMFYYPGMDWIIWIRGTMALKKKAMPGWMFRSASYRKDWVVVEKIPEEGHDVTKAG